MKKQIILAAILTSTTPMHSMQLVRALQASCNKSKPKNDIEVNEIIEMHNAQRVLNGLKQKQQNEIQAPRKSRCNTKTAVGYAVSALMLGSGFELVYMSYELWRTEYLKKNCHKG